MPDPGSVGRIPVGGRFDKGDLTQDIPFDDLPGLLKNNILRDLVAQLKYTVTVPDRIIYFV